MAKVEVKHMTGDDLKEVLTTISDTLKLNKRTVNPALIKLIRDVVKELRVIPVVQQTTTKVLLNQAKPQGLGDVDFDKVFDGILKALEIEEKLLGQQGDDMIKVCDNTAQRPVILSLLARFIVR